MFTGFTAQVTARMVREVFRNASLRSLVGHSWGKNIDGDVFAGGRFDQWHLNQCSSIYYTMMHRVRRGTFNPLTL